MKLSDLARGRTVRDPLLARGRYGRTVYRLFACSCEPHHLFVVRDGQAHDMARPVTAAWVDDVLEPVGA